MKKMSVVLASSSQNRQEGFEIAQIPIEIMPADVDEKSIKEKDFKKRAIKIARLKAWAVLNIIRRQEAVVIAGDGFNVLNGKILEKPKTVKEGILMLKLLSGNVTTFFSGLVMVNVKTKEKMEKVVATKAWFRDLNSAEIEDYVKSVDVTKYSAAYSPLNTKAISFIKKVEGSLSGFSHSVPMDVVVPYLIKWKAL